MEKVIFINTPLQDYSKVKKKKYDTASPIGLGYLATVVKNLGYEVCLLDAEEKGLSPKEIVNFVRKNRFDTVCINLLSPTLALSKKIIEALKDLKIIVGGAHATLYSEEILKKIKGVDIVIVGEGEETIKEIFEGRRLDKIKGISYIKNKKIIHNKRRDLIENLDELPFIDRSLFSNEKKEATVSASRGCPHNCIFCAGPLIEGRKIRVRSVKNVIDELEGLSNKNIHFIDNNFIYSKKRILDFVKELKNRNLKIKWRALVRADIIARLDISILGKIKESGCYQFSFGLESGSERILKLIKKGFTLEDTRKAVDLCKKAGIKVKAYFMLGFPTETIKEIRQTINFASTLTLNSTCFVTVKAYPGTKMFKMLGNQTGLLEYKQLQGMIKLSGRERALLKERGIDLDEFNKYSTININPISTLGLNRLLNTLKEAYQECYLR